MKLHRARRAGLLGALLAATVILEVAATASAGPSAHAAATCKPPKYPGLGYFTSLQVTGTTCSEGGKVANAYYTCRLKHGVKGRCTTTVLHYRCTEKRNSIPTEIDARVTCKYHKRTVVHTYQQNT